MSLLCLNNNKTIAIRTYIIVFHIYYLNALWSTFLRSTLYFIHNNSNVSMMTELDVKRYVIIELVDIYFSLEIKSTDLNGWILITFAGSTVTVEPTRQIRQEMH